MVVQMKNTAASRFVTEGSRWDTRIEQLRKNVTKRYTTPLDDGNLFAGRYRKIAELGGGGMGVVYLMEDTELDDERVAIKMLPPYLADNEDALHLIALEAKNARKLHHNHIVCVRHYAKYKKTPYIVMDYIAGKTLREELQERGALPEDEVIALLKPIASALDYAHRPTPNRCAVLHRDIKPDNIIFQKYDDGTVYPVILDFGISKAIVDVQDKGQTATMTRFRRTPGYAAPEKLQDSQCESTVPQDIFSFAVLAYECLTGDLPFGKSEDGKALDRIRNSEFKRIGSGSALAKAVERGLSYSPEDRPRTCLEFFAEPPQAARPAAASTPQSEPTPQPEPVPQPEPEVPPDPVLPTRTEPQPQRETAECRPCAFSVPPHDPVWVVKSEILMALCADYRVMLAESAVLHRDDDALADEMRDVQALLRDAVETEENQVDSTILICLFNRVAEIRKQYLKAHRGAVFFMEHRRRNVELRIVTAGESPWGAAMKKSIRI